MKNTGIWPTALLIADDRCRLIVPAGVGRRISPMPRKTPSVAMVAITELIRTTVTRIAFSTPHAPPAAMASRISTGTGSPGTNDSSTTMSPIIEPSDASISPTSKTGISATATSDSGRQSWRIAPALPIVANRPSRTEA
jgi:hypothetical protein